MIVSPPPSSLYARPRTVVKSVSFSNDNPIIIIPPNQNQQQAEAPPIPPGHQSTGTHVAAEGAEPARVRFAGGMTEGCRTATVRSGSSGTGDSPALRATLATSCRRCRGGRSGRGEGDFSGEYHYYPTPIREGIYEIATDANRLTTIF
ncbi:hypothetical protein HPP92_019475 [Vanilla planifolia]|uniref:Uncharacterized protein n=1 Tax=Vanilla planifolia TaxID=51239 RepID=A0A835UMY0_VANPL|nr:hypothetical protein HPP92_019475 [Vanilla planifolia]